MEIIYSDILKHWTDCWQEAITAGMVFTVIGGQVDGGNDRHRKVLILLFVDGVFLYYLLYVTLFSRSAGSRREVDFLPFMGEEISNGDFHYLIENILLFIPFSVLVSKTLYVYGKKCNTKVILLAALLTSLSVEFLQYAFACGKSETDDVLANVTGALIGYWGVKLKKGLIKVNIFTKMLLYKVRKRG